MPDVNYVITIKGDGVGGQLDTNGVAPSPSVATSEKDSTVKVPSVFRKIAPAAIAMQIGRSVIQGELSRVELRTGYSTLQERINFAMSKGQMLLGGIIGGATVGGPVGAVVGGMTVMLGQAIEFTQNQITLDLNRSIENISIGMANVRAGAGGDRTGQR